MDTFDPADPSRRAITPDEAWNIPREWTQEPGYPCCTCHKAPYSQGKGEQRWACVSASCGFSTIYPGKYFIKKTPESVAA